MLANPDSLKIMLAALAGGMAGKFMRVPGGALLMATITVAVVCNALHLSHTVPPGLITAIQVLVGCMLGQSINRNFWRDFLTIWKPCLAVILIYSIASLPFALLLIKACGFDPISAVLAANPARMQDMIVLAGSLRLDAVMVMLMQLCRQFVIIGVTPLMLAKYTRKTSCAHKKRKCLKELFQLPSAKNLRRNAADYALLLFPAILGSFLGKLSGHALGPLLGAFTAVAASRILWLRAGGTPFPRPFAFVIQCLAGILLGVRITPEITGLIVDKAAPLIAAVLFVLAAGLLIAAVLHRRFGWHKGLAWMAAAPGRASDMLAVSQDMDLTSHDRLALACVHTVRQVYFTLFVSAVTLIL